MKLKLHTVSPIHIGTGNSLEPFEYIIENNIFYRLDKDKAFKLALERHPHFPEKFSSWIDSTTSKLKTARSNQEQAEIRKKFNFKYFCETILQDPKLAALIIEKGFAYKCSVPYGTLNKKQVLELLKTYDNQPIIPGSSIKGAIRTILAWRAFKNMGDNEKRNLLKKITNSKAYERKKGKDLDTPLEEELFNCGKKKFHNGVETADYSDIKFDLMKFVRITDATPTNAKIAVYPANLYLTNKPPQTQTPALEVIEFNSSFVFEIKINEDELRHIYNSSKSQNSKIWLGFNQKFKRIFGFDPDNIERGKLEEKIIESIKYTITDYYKTQFEREMKWIEKFREEIQVDRKNRTNAHIKSIREFYEVYKSISIMFRIGWASGFTSTTIFDALETNPITKPFIQELFADFKIGIPPTSKKDPNITPADVSKFPKSKRFKARTEEIPIDPFGWVALLTMKQNLELE